MPSKTSKIPFKLLLEYLQGKEDAHGLRTAFRVGTFTQDAFAAYKNTPFTLEQKQQLETALGVPADATVEHADNLLDLIDNLNKAGYGYGQLADFRYQLKNIHPEPDWTGTLLFTTLLTGIISTFFFLNPKQLERLEGALLRVAPFIAPVLLVGFQFYTIFRQAYKTRYEDTYHSDSHRARRWLVGTLPSILNLSAYVAIAAIGSMSPLAAVLFVSSSVVAVLDSAISFYHLKTAEKQEELDTASATRQNNRKERTGQTFWVKMYAAVALSATVAISCIFPPTIFVVLSCTALFILIPMTKNSWLNKIHTDSSQQLLAELRDLDEKNITPAEENVLEQEIVDVPALQAELQSYKARLTVAEAPPSRVGLFKPAMVDFSAVSGGDSSNAIEASLLSPCL
jgi:hypothetical protein